MTSTKTLALVAEVERLTRELAELRRVHDQTVADGVAGFKAMADELAEAKQSAALYRWLRPRMMGADFDWNESGAVCLVFEMPPDTQFSADCDKTIDAAMRRTDDGAKSPTTP